MSLSQTLHCISLAPARLDRYPRGFTGHVAHPGRSIRPLGLPIHVASKPRRSGGHKNGFETRLLPTLTRSYPCRFTFYVADPVSSIDRSRYKRLLSAMSVSLLLGVVYLISELLLATTRRSRSRTGMKQDRSTLRV